VIAPDLRGFGWSEAPGEGYNGETFARDQVALLDALGIDRASVIGHDWGGWTTFLLGLNHAERVDRLIVCNAPHPWPKLSPRTLVDQMPRAWYAVVMATPLVGKHLQTDTDLVIRALKGSSAPGTFDDAELAIYADAFRDPERAEAASSLYRYYLSLNASGIRNGALHRGRLTAPSLLLFGENDMAISNRLIRDGWQEHADDLTIEFTDNGHFIVNEDPGLVADRALSFFA
jgi:pimeloyl-ACP methyl ester carboxylesterase